MSSVAWKQRKCRMPATLDFQLDQSRIDSVVEKTTGNFE